MGINRYIRCKELGTKVYMISDQHWTKLPITLQQTSVIRLWFACTKNVRNNGNMKEKHFDDSKNARLQSILLNIMATYNFITTKHNKQGNCTQHRLHSRCRILTNSTKHRLSSTSNWYGTATWWTSSKQRLPWFCSLVLYYENITSSIKPEIHYALQRCQRRAEPRLHAQKFGQVQPRGFRVMRAKRQTYSSQYFETLCSEVQSW